MIVYKDLKIMFQLFRMLLTLFVLYKLLCKLLCVCYNEMI